MPTARSSARVVSKVVCISSGVRKTPGARRRTPARRNALIEEHIHLVPPIAWNVIRVLKPSFEVEDLISAGSMGLMEAAEQYRPSSGTPFAIYARMRIRGAMIDSVRRGEYIENTRPPLSDAPEPVMVPVIECHIAQRQALARLRQAIARLPDDQRDVMLAYLVVERIEDAAKQLRIPYGRAVKLYRAAVARLRRELPGVVAKTAFRWDGLAKVA